MTTTEFDQARTQQATAADDIERQAILLATLEEDLVRAKDELALVDAELRLERTLSGKNAEDREAEFLLRLEASELRKGLRDLVTKAKANVETQRAALERARNRRQEWLWVMRHETRLDLAPVDEL